MVLNDIFSMPLYYDKYTTNEKNLLRQTLLQYACKEWTTAKDLFKFNTNTLPKRSK